MTDRPMFFGRRTRNKYHVAPPEERTMDGILFASKKEMTRYSHLNLLLRDRVIFCLELQPKFPIVVNNVHVCTYIADFSYRDEKDKFHVEDAKGVRTDIYKLKAKLVHALYGFRIEET